MDEEKLLKKVKSLTKRVDRLEKVAEMHLKAIDLNTALILKIKERDRKKFEGIFKEVMLESAIREVENDNRP